MSEHVLIGIAVVFLLGIGAQWVAWRFKFPSILLLLIFGFVAGPISGVLDPATLQGDWVFAFVGVAVGIILFEGGLSLRIDELREIGRAVLNLITIGAAVTFLLTTAAAYYITGFNLSMSFITGAILVVTGPTVVMPLLRLVRPTSRVGAVAKWEGITIDPIGAILAVLVLDIVLLMHETTAGPIPRAVLGPALLHTLEGLVLHIVIGTAVSFIGAALLLLLLRRRLVPDYLQSSIALMIVVGVFVLADVLRGETGLLATTLMGIMVANQKIVHVRRIIEFKEDLRVMLLGSLFILLSARLEMTDLISMANPSSLIFLAVLMLVVRPVSVFISSFKTKLTWDERLFLAWLAPRGVVAAAVASLFSFRLQELYPQQAEALVPLIFLVIVGTVAIYGLTIVPIARKVGVAQPSPQGVLFVGAHHWAQKLALALSELDYKVLLLDSNPANVDTARLQGLSAQQADVLAEGVMDDLDLSGIGRLLALTPNDEVNSLAALNFAELFDSAGVYQLASKRQDQAAKQSLPRHLRGRPLFGADTTFSTISASFQRGATVETIPVLETVSYGDFRRRNEGLALPVFIIRASGYLDVISDGQSEGPAYAGDTIVAIVEPRSATDVAEESNAAADTSFK
jgi:NhaP-type Na+/H+ or K+/H+ antiporter